MAKRILMDLFAELYVDDMAHPAVIHKLSRFGAFVRCNQERFAGSYVELAIKVEGEPRIVNPGTIVYRVRAADATRLGTVAGIGIRFCDPFSGEADRFATAVDQLLSATPFVGKPTRRMDGPILSSLLEAVTPSQTDRLVFSGSLAGLGVPTLLSMLESTRKTGRLVLVRDLMTAKLEFSEGVIVGVRSTAADHSPAKTLMIVAGWNEGTFELASIAPPPCPVGGAPRLSVTKLLLAHALLQDVTAHRQPKPA